MNEKYNVCLKNENKWEETVGFSDHRKGWG
jgi:hypothetical protein